MGGRFSPIIIIILTVLVIAIGYLIYQVVVGGDSTNPNSPGISGSDNLIEPVLNLEKEVKDSETVKILVNAKTDDELGIERIILPNGTEALSDSIEYEVTENDVYSFKAIGANGTETELSIEVTEIEGPSATNPYIPEGFEKIGGDIESGFVISDQYDNQYVWVPVPTGKLKRETELNTKYDESNSAAQALTNSVSNYYGFYIGRFEASEYEFNGTTVAATMAGKSPWTNITCVDATEYASKVGYVFGYGDDIHTSLINSSAWDTTIAWIEEAYPGYSSSDQYGNFGGTIYPTGQTEKDRLREICDLSGNVREWTTEKYLGTDTTTSTSSKNSKNKNKNVTENVIMRVVRGGSASLSRTPMSRIGYDENTFDLYWGFRVILYKQ